MSTKTYSVFKHMFFPLLDKLDMEYWCTHCGVDGYLYLLFQRRFFKLTLYMSAISFGSQILLFFIEKDYTIHFFGTNNQDFFTDTEQSKADKNKTHKSMFDLVSNISRNNEELSSQKAWLSITIIFTFTLLTIRIVQKTRRDAKVALESFY